MQKSDVSKWHIFLCIALQAPLMLYLRTPMVFILFIAVSVFRHIVPQLYIHIKQSRVHSRKALYECKASRRLGKQMRCFYRFLSKAQPYSRFIQQPKLRIPSSPYRSNHLSFPSAEVQILPFYIPLPTLYLL